MQSRATEEENTLSPYGREYSHAKYSRNSALSTGYQKIFHIYPEANARKRRRRMRKYGKPDGKKREIVRVSR
jgi:hypothetical protein